MVKTWLIYIYNIYIYTLLITIMVDHISGHILEAIPWKLMSSDIGEDQGTLRPLPIHTALNSLILPSGNDYGEHG